MATSTTEAFTISKHDAYPLNTDIISKANEKLWSGEIVATASTHGFWEPDKEFKIKVKVNELKRKFHLNRFLQVKHLPRDVAEGEIRQMLSDFPISSVILSCGHGSAGSASAYLEDAEMLEDWDRERHFLLRGQRIPVCPSPTETVLCVARFPLNYSELSFTGLVSSYGEVKMCFLMISEKTGKSKGYGFVEYTTREAALFAKSRLDGMLINDRSLCAEFIDSTHLTFESLHSKCLYVDNLPKNFRDMGEFRSIFSLVVKPPYCQIALKNGCPQDWGLVEYNTGDDAEHTLTQLNGYELRDRKLRISYYVPGVRAINLYLKLLNEPEIGRVKSAGLLPDPPAPAVYQTFKNLQKQNPVFAQNLQNIMFSELLGGGNGTQEPTVNGQVNGEDTKHTTSFPAKPPGVLTNKTNLIPAPPPPPPPAANTIPVKLQQDPNEQQSAILNIIASQLQAQLAADGLNPAFLHSPQMVSILKNCVKGAMNGTPPVIGGLTPVLPPGLIHYPATLQGIPGSLPVSAMSGVQSFHQPMSFDALLNDPRTMTIINPAMLQKIVGLHPQDAIPGAPYTNPVLAEEIGSPLTAVTGPSPEHFWSAVMGNAGQPQSIDPAKSLDPKNVLTGVGIARGHPAPALPEHFINIHNPAEQILNARGIYQNGVNKSHHDLNTVLNTDKRQQQQQPATPSATPAVVVVGDRNKVQDTVEQTDNCVSGFFQRNSFTHGFGVKIDGPNESTHLQTILNDAQTSLNHFLGKMNGTVHPSPTINIQQNFLQSHQNQNNHIDATANNYTNRGRSGSADGSSQTNSDSSSSVPSPQPNGSVTCDKPTNARHLSPNIESSDTRVKDIRRPASVPTLTSPNPNHLAHPLWAMNIPPPPITTRPPPTLLHTETSPQFLPPRGILSPIHLTPKPVGYETKWTPGVLTPPPLVPSYPPPHSGRIRGVWNPRINFSCPPPNVNVTPMGQKRKYPKILPSPEPSPEGNYIGQHSQGIGGHYADSYFKRKKKN